MQRRIRTSLAISVSAVLLLGACSTSGNAPGAGTDGWQIPSEAPEATIQVLTMLEAERLQKVVDAFNVEYPSVTVDIEEVPFSDLNSVLEARMAAKDSSPDVFWADMPRMSALASRGYAVDLTEQFGQFKDEFDPASWEGSSVDGKLFGVPIANSTQLLFYNKDLLDQAGLEYPSAEPESRITWEDLKADALKAKEAGSKYGFAFGQVGRYYQVQPLPMSLGGSAGGTGEGNLTPDITGDAWLKSMEFYQSLFADGASPKDLLADQTEPEFKSGNIAYFVQGPWLLPAMESADFNWGVALHPSFADGDPVTPTGSWAVSMSPFSDEKDAAALFLRWLAVDGGGGYTKNMADPELPATPAAKVDYFKRSIFESEEGQRAASIIDYETSNTAANRLATVGYVEFEEVLGRAFSDISKGTDPAKALETAQTELETAWAPYNKK